MFLKHWVLASAAWLVEARIDSQTFKVVVAASGAVANCMGEDFGDRFP